MTTFDRQLKVKTLYRFLRVASFLVANGK